MMDLPCRRFIDGRPVELDTEFNPWTDYPEDGTDKHAAPPVRRRVMPPSQEKWRLSDLVKGEARIFRPEPGQHINNLRQRLWSSAWNRRTKYGEQYTQELVEDGAAVMVKRIR